MPVEKTQLQLIRAGLGRIIDRSKQPGRQFISTDDINRGIISKRTPADVRTLCREIDAARTNLLGLDIGILQVVDIMGRQMEDLQNQLNKTSGDLNTALGENKTLAGSLDKLSATLQTERTEHATEVQGLRDSLSHAQDLLTSIADTLCLAPEKIAEAPNKIEFLRGKLTELQNKIDNHKTEARKQGELFERTFAELRTAYDGELSSLRAHLEQAQKDASAEIERIRSEQAEEYSRLAESNQRTLDNNHSLANDLAKERARIEEFYRLIASIVEVLDELGVKPAKAHEIPDKIRELKREVQDTEVTMRVKLGDAQQQVRRSRRTEELAVVAVRSHEDFIKRMLGLLGLPEELAQMQEGERILAALVSSAAAQPEPTIKEPIILSQNETGNPKSKYVIDNYAIISDVGTKRSNNEDAAGAQGEVLAVLDGMGGHEAGDYAAKIALKAFFANLDAGMNMVNAAHQAAKVVITEANRLQGKEGMGTTLVALRVDRINKIAQFIKIGDSRIKAVNSSLAINIGKDHSLEMELADVLKKQTNDNPVPELLKDEEIEFYENLIRQDSPGIAGKNVITSCLGREKALKITYLEIPIEEIGPQEEPTTLLLYSDGAIRGSMTETIITEEARNGGTPEQIAKNIVSRALASGSPDNVTAAAVKVPYRLMFDETEIKTFKTDSNGNLVRVKNEPQAPAAPEPAPAVPEPAPEPTPAAPELTGKSYIQHIKVAGRLFGKKDITVIFQCYGSQQIDENIRQAIAEAAAKTAKSNNVNIYFSKNMDLAKIISPTNANKFLQAVKELIALKAKKQSAQDIYIYLQKIENKLHLSVEFNEIPPEAAQYF